MNRIRNKIKVFETMLAAGKFKKNLQALKPSEHRLFYSQVSLRVTKDAIPKPYQKRVDKARKATVISAQKKQQKVAEIVAAPQRMNHIT